MDRLKVRFENQQETVQLKTLLVHNTAKTTEHLYLANHSRMFI